MRCQRCQGYMINDHFMDVLNVGGEMDFEGWRCLNCGDITDPIIVRHHQSPAHAPQKSKRRWWEPLSCIPVREEEEGLQVAPSDDAAFPFR